MAQRLTVALEDDLDGGPADETVRFGVGTTEYEIDLNQKNAARLRARLAPLVEHARRVGRGQPRRAARTGASRQHSADVRAWALGRASRSVNGAGSRRALSLSTRPHPRAVTVTTSAALRAASRSDCSHLPETPYRADERALDMRMTIR
jgi:Lsr2